jgi:hypothetical protein
MLVAGLQLLWRAEGVFSPEYRGTMLYFDLLLSFR